MKDHEKRFDESIKTVKRQATELSNAGRKFGSGIKHAWGTIDKVTSEQGLRLTQLIEDTSQEVVKKHTKSTYQEAETFHEQSVAASNKIILAVRRYVPKIHRTLKSEISTLNSSLLKLEESINSLGKSLDQSPGSKLNPLDREITLITQAHELLNKTRSQKEQTNKQIENATNEEKTLIQQKESLLTHPKFQEHNLTQTQATAKRKEMDQLTQPLIKPLLKLERAMTNQETPLVDDTVLRNFIDDPVQSILTTPPSTNLKVLRALEIELNQGSLDIDERKRKRTEDSITEVAESIEPFRATILQLQEATKRIDQELHTSGLQAKLSQLDALLDNKGDELQSLRTVQNDNDRRIEELTRTIAKHKSSIESQILSLSKEQVSIDVT
jgi:chromosome segregation ATPase